MAGVCSMIEQAIFSPEVVEGLKAKGFTPIGRSKLAWFFEDSVLLEAAVAELVAALEDNDK